MSLDTTLGIASGGLANISLGLSIISQNVANASTPQYTAETATQQSLSVDGQASGVRSGLVLRSSDPGLQAQLSDQVSQDANSEIASSALSALQPVLGTVGNGNDLGSRLTAMQASFSSLLSDPADTTQQSTVVTTAQDLANSVNALSRSYGQARQTAQDGLKESVVQLDTALESVGKLSRQVITLRAQGQSTADVENQRSSAENVISRLVATRFLDQPNGDVVVLTAGGVQLPTTGGTSLSLSNATLGATASYPSNGVPGIELGSTDITAQLTGGQIGAQLTLRDVTLPTYQASIDEFARTLSTRFADQGLTLFTDGTGTVPLATSPSTQAGYVGYGSVMQVNPAITANPALVRDGTQAIVGSPTGASAFTPNYAAIAGFDTMVKRVLDYALGGQVQDGVEQNPINTQNLGPTGTLNPNLGSLTRLGDYANALTVSQASDSAGASAGAIETKAVLTSLQDKMTQATGVSMDAELGKMIVLQNAYGANAKIISAIQALFTETLAMVT